MIALHGSNTVQILELEIRIAKRVCPLNPRVTLSTVTLTAVSRNFAIRAASTCRFFVTVYYSSISRSILASYPIATREVSSSGARDFHGLEAVDRTTWLPAASNNISILLDRPLLNVWSLVAKNSSIGLRHAVSRFVSFGNAFLRLTRAVAQHQAANYRSFIGPNAQRADCFRRSILARTVISLFLGEEKNETRERPETRREKKHVRVWDFSRVRVDDGRSRIWNMYVEICMWKRSAKWTMQDATWYIDAWNRPWTRLSILVLDFYYLRKLYVRDQQKWLEENVARRCCKSLIHQFAAL